MISRYWKGVVKSEMVEDYVLHLKEDTLDIIHEMDGYKSATVLRKDLSNGVEFVVITEWESLKAIEKFAGADVGNAVVPEKAKGMMVSYDSKVTHYEVVSKI